MGAPDETHTFNNDIARALLRGIKDERRKNLEKSVSLNLRTHPK
jgi:hypothetical protein